ncbi:MAG: hypothetical protein NT027_02925 [Proteobacteria bacterium]|nr:hypothetical protein [Pseudomonadota bacterium]
MTEVLTTRTCGYCKENRDWIWNGTKLKDGSKVYLDLNGLRWAGRRCPNCEKNRVATAVRHDNFDREMIFQQFIDRGFTIVSKTHPFSVQKDGVTYQVGVRRARTEGANIVVESGAEQRDEIIALVFESVRLVTPQQLGTMTIYSQTSESPSLSHAPSLAAKGEAPQDSHLL